MKLPLSLFQERYVPIIPDGQPALTAAHSWKSIVIHTASQPDRICGSARRVGYTGSHAEALAIYRLRVLFRSRTVMLPSLFVFQEGSFVSYGDEPTHEKDLLQETM